MKHAMASSCSVGVNKFTNISDFNKKLSNQPPQIPPIVNYNNYFNHNKYRNNSKSRADNGSNSLTNTQNNSKPRIKTANRSDSQSNQRRNNTIGNRKNSFIASDSENIKSSNPDTKTSRHAIIDQR